MNEHWLEAYDTNFSEAELQTARGNDPFDGSSTRNMSMAPLSFAEYFAGTVSGQERPGGPWNEALSFGGENENLDGYAEAMFESESLDTFTEAELLADLGEGSAQSFESPASFEGFEQFEQLDGYEHNEAQRIRPSRIGGQTAGQRLIRVLLHPTTQQALMALALGSAGPKTVTSRAGRAIPVVAVVKVLNRLTANIANLGSSPGGAFAGGRSSQGFSSEMFDESFNGVFSEAEAFAANIFDGIVGGPR